MHVIIQCKQQFWILAVRLSPLDILLKNEAQVIQRISHFSTYIITTQHDCMPNTQLAHINDINKFTVSYCNNSTYQITCD